MITRDAGVLSKYFLTGRDTRRKGRLNHCQEITLDY